MGELVYVRVSFLIANGRMYYGRKTKTDKTKIEQTSSVLGNGSDAKECFMGSYCVCETLVGSMHVRHTGHLLGPTLQMKC